jgi:membrane protein implicated in regulation of membrane protease activity
MEYFTQHQDYFFYALAGICLLVELSLLGMSGPLLFVALGSVITGVLMSLGLIHSLSIALVVLAGVSLASAALLWAPLKKLQNNAVGPETSSDMVGKVLSVTTRITQADGRVSYSGVEWLARLDSSSSEPIEPEQRVEVTSVDGTILVVKAAVIV